MSINSSTTNLSNHNSNLDIKTINNQSDIPNNPNSTSPNFFSQALQSIDILSSYHNIGDKTLQSLRDNGISKIIDLLLFYPRNSRTVPLSTLASLGTKESITAISGTIVKINHTKHAKIKYIIDFKDTSGTTAKLLFSSNLPLSFKPGQKVIIYGKHSNRTFVHPKILYSWHEEQFHYEAKMPLTDSKIQQCIKYALSLLPSTSTGPLSQYTNTSNWHEFFSQLHGLQGMSKHLSSRSALQYLEAVAWHISAKQAQNQLQNISTNTSHHTYTALSPEYHSIYQQLTKDLTPCQSSAFTDILSDLQHSTTTSLTPSPTNTRHRMIFGDVCTGKTRLAMLSSLFVISHGHQVWLIAPTTMLAKQHYENFLKTFSHLPSIKILLHNKKEDTSQANIIIGTHSLLHTPPSTATIGLIIIDEQHKFGVLQRHSLITKDTHNQSYILSLSATPIPRSLALVAQKYINVSIMRTRTRPISLKTICLPHLSVDELIDKLEEQSNSGLVYWVCPLIDENEQDLISVQQRYESLRSKYGDKVGYIHGAMKQDEQTRVYESALTGQISILVSTTVIEVGIDIPTANLIIIEHAERFGLAQLHQLRGRVGRYGNDGLCILLYKQFISNNAKERLSAMKRISNGFELAEIDLQIRGQGTLLGLQQTGFNEFTFLDPIRDCEILTSTFTLANTLNYTQHQSFVQCFFSPESLTS